MNHLVRPSRPHGLSASVLILAGSALAASLLVSCASSRVATEPEACRVMREQVREKQELDARIKKLSKETQALRKSGDDAAAAESEERLRVLIENQRYLKESLERSSHDCSPTMQETSPVLDPARRQRMENP